MNALLRVAIVLAILVLAVWVIGLLPLPVVGFPIRLLLQILAGLAAIVYLAREL